MRSPRLSRKDELSLISNLATMLGSGIPILEAVDTLMEESKGPSRTVLQLLHDALIEGHPISEAMSKAPHVFDPVTINLMKAAEEAGTMEDALRDLAENIKKDMAFSDKIRGSMLYPMFVLAIFFAVLLLILLFVIPRVAKVFSGLRVELPAVTQGLIAVSDFLLTYYPYLLGGLVVFVILTVVIYRSQKRAIVNMLLTLPLLSHLGRLIDLTRFTRSMGLMLHSGVPVSEALTLAREVVIKKEVVKMVENMRQSVTAGHSISESLKSSKGTVPPLMIHIIQTAEMSGTLEKTMQELTEYFSSQVTRTLKTITTLIEPVMIVVIGVLVGGMMLAIMAPIYNIISQLSTR